MNDAKQIRQKIRLLKELPPLPIMAQKILALSNDDADIAALAETIEKDPCLSARILGLANAAYFGWPGGVRTMYDAIYKVLGLRMVKNLAVGLILGGLFRVEKCRGFSMERYWFNAVATAIMSQNLFPHMSPDLRHNLDSIYLDGLLHDLGLPVLVHLFPEEIDQVFSAQNEQVGRTLNEISMDVLGIDPRRAGGLLARKWHLPEDIVRVIECREDSSYGGDFWPIVLLVGYCARQAGSLYSGDEFVDERDLMGRLGISEASLEKEKRATIGNLAGIREMAVLFSRNGSING
jgi:HD-like signal output (HDOD) protein